MVQQLYQELPQSVIIHLILLYFQLEYLQDQVGRAHSEEQRASLVPPLLR